MRKAKKRSYNFLAIGGRLFAICRAANTKTVMTVARKHSKHNVPQQFVEMLRLQNKPWLVRYKKIRTMSFLPNVECGKLS